MLSEYEDRARALLARVARRDDYGTLLMKGEVIRREKELRDPEAWRADIRKQARADRIRIQTTRRKGRVAAFVVDAPVSMPEPVDISFDSSVEPDGPLGR